MFEIRNYFYEKEDAPIDGYRHYAKADASLITIQIDGQEPITFLAVTGARRKKMEAELVEIGATL